MDYSPRATFGGRHFSGLSTMVPANEDIYNPTYHAEDGTAHSHAEHQKRPGGKSSNPMTVSLDMDVVAQYISSSN